MVKLYQLCCGVAEVLIRDLLILSDAGQLSTCDFMIF